MVQNTNIKQESYHYPSYQEYSSSYTIKQLQYIQIYMEYFQLGSDEPEEGSPQGTDLLYTYDSVQKLLATIITAVTVTADQLQSLWYSLCWPVIGYYNNDIIIYNNKLVRDTNLYLQQAQVDLLSLSNLLHSVTSWLVQLNRRAVLLHQ